MLQYALLIPPITFIVVYNLLDFVIFFLLKFSTDDEINKSDTPSSD